MALGSGKLHKVKATGPMGEEVEAEYLLDSENSRIYMEVSL